MASDLRYQKCEDRKIWTDWYCFHERGLRTRLQVGKHEDGDCFYDTKGACNAKPEYGPLTDETALDVEHESCCEGKEENCNRPELGVSVIDEEEIKFAGGHGKSREKYPWERAPTSLRPASGKSADDGRDGLLVRRSSSTISSNSSSSFCDLPNNTTDPTPPSLSTRIAKPALQQPTPSLTTLLFSDPDPIDLDNPIDPSSPALDDPDIFDAFLDACIEKTRALIAAAEGAPRSSSSSDADFGRRNGLFLGDDDDRVEGRYDDRGRRGATMPEEDYPLFPPHRLISYSGSRDAAALEARFNNDGNGALGCVCEVGRGRAEVAPKKEIVMVEGWWKVKDGEASWKEIGADGCGVDFVG